jgi:alkanesulfonate monooxygenase SsuD/methylene tetrahydromethanopterin reductase-like flavin-dependent oxidoreductase (luciferase family)
MTGVASLEVRDVVAEGYFDRMTILGAVFLPQLPPERLRSVVRAADEAGLEELWLWEDCFRESGIASAAAALAWTERVTIGVGLLPVPLRNVALTAMEVANLERMFPGRLRIGVGHGVQDWMAQVGAEVESPVTLLREHLDALRALLRGETLNVKGRYVSLDSVALDWPPASPPAIYAGAIGPRSLRLSGASADGTILVAGTTPERLRQSVALVEAGRAEAGRTDHHHVTVNLHAATGPDAAQRLSANMQRYGYASHDDSGVAGGAETVARAVRRWAEAGAGTVVLQPTEDDPDPEGFVRFVADEVRPLLS